MLFVAAKKLAQHPMILKQRVCVCVCVRAKVSIATYCQRSLTQRHAVTRAVHPCLHRQPFRIETHGASRHPVLPLLLAPLVDACSLSNHQRDVFSPLLPSHVRFHNAHFGLRTRNQLNNGLHVLLILLQMTAHLVSVLVWLCSAEMCSPPLPPAFVQPRPCLGMANPSGLQFDSK